jgi:arylsulfatase A-like enzyme
MTQVIEALPQTELDALLKRQPGQSRTPPGEMPAHPAESNRPAPATCPNVARATGRDVLLVAVSLGLITGFLESLYWGVKRFVLGEFTYLHREVFWMAPAMYAGIFLTAGLLLIPVVRKVRHPALLTGIVVVLALLAAWCALLLFGWMHTVAQVLLAVGVAAQAGKWFDRNQPRAIQLLRRATCVLVLLTVGIAALQQSIRSLGESRAMAALPAATDHAPNVLLIVMDTVRADALGTYGAPRAATPNLDRLAQRGVLFENASSTAPWTLPSTASLMTGRLPSELSADWLSPLDGRFPTLAEFLSGRGYASAGFVANYKYCTEESGLSRGFAHYEDHELSLAELAECTALGRRLLFSPWLPRLGCYHDPVRKSAADVNAAFLDWLPETATTRSAADEGARPWFAFLNYLDAHDPYAAPPPFNTHRPADVSQRTMLRFWWFLDRSRLQAGDVPLTTGAYADCIRYLDAELGRLLDSLAARGALQNTLIIVTADHGEHFGEHGLYLHGNSLYEPLVHVPLLMVWPDRVADGTRVGAPVSLAAVPATIQDLLEIDRGPFEAGSLADWWRTPGAPRADRPVMAEVLTPPITPPCQGASPIFRGSMRSVRLGKYKLIQNADGGVELFDLTVDPGEQFDLAPMPEWQSTVKQLRSLLGSEA